MMIKLSDGCYVAADEIAEIKVNRDRQHLEVRLKGGREYLHEPKYGQGVYAALTALVAKVNAAKEPT